MHDNEFEKCAIARTLSIIGDKWTLLILRNLFLEGNGRFQSLLDSLEPVSPNTLSTKLKNLEQEGIIDKVLYQYNPPRAEYKLTEKGLALGPVLLQIRDWGQKYLDEK